MKKLRKALVISVMSITVLSTTLFVAPIKVGAAAQAGDLIKMNGLSSVYYLAADGKRYVFPNEATYFSWYSDFSGVVTVPQAELESYPLGKNVTVRPGTKLVKITTNPKVYAVTTNGTLLAIPDEATAKTLYGANWAKRVVDVADSFFQNYTISTDTVSATAYPAGTLAKFGTDATVYYIAADGTARAISNEAAMAANRFKMTDVITATIAKPTLGTAIAGAEAGLTDTASGAGGFANAGTGMSVSLSSDTATSANLPSYSTLVPFMTVNLTAAADGAVTVQNMTFVRTGTGSTADFDGGYLFSGSDRLSTKRSVNSSDNTISFNALNLTIPAGTTKAITLKMNARTGGTVTGNHAFKLASASAIVTNGAVVSGSFPIMGNLMSYSAVNAATVTLTGAGNDTNPKIGESNVILGEFDLANNEYEDVNVYSIRLKQDGDASVDAVKNISLALDGTTVKTGVTMTADKYVEFMLDTPFLLKKSKTITATVRGDIVTDINKTVKLYMNNVADIDARGTAYGNNYSATIVATSFASGNANIVTIKGSDIDVSLDGPLASDIKDDTTNTVLANFKIKSNSGDVNIETLRVRLLQSATSTVSSLTNLELVDSSNNVSYSVSDPTFGNVNLDFENIYLTKGVQYNFQLRGDVPNGAWTGVTYSADFGFATYAGTDVASIKAHFQDANETTVDADNFSSSSLTGKVMTIAAPSIALDMVPTSNSTYVENTKGVLLFKGKLTASAVSDLKVSKLKFIATSTTEDLGASFDKLYLYAASDDMGTPLDTETSLSGVAGVTFTGFNLTVPKGTANGIYVTLRGDVKNNPTAGVVAMKWSPAATADFTAKDENNDALPTASFTNSSTAGHTTTIAGAGTFTMAFDTSIAGVNANKNVLAGSEVLVGAIKLTAQNEAVNLKDFTLLNQAGTATAADVAYINLYSNKEMTTKIGSATVDASKRVIFQDANIEIPTSAAKYIYVGAVLRGINYSTANMSDSTGTAGRTVILEIASTTYSTDYDVKAIGVSTGDELSDSGVTTTTQAKTATVMGAVISNITSAFANGLLSAGTKDIFSFKVTAPASTNVDYDSTALGVRLSDVYLSIASSAALDLSGLKIERVGGGDGEKTAYSTGTTPSAEAAGRFLVNFPATYAGGTNGLNDLTIKPGETAEYVVRGVIGGTTTNGSLQITLEGLTSNVNYTHNTAVTRGTYDSQTSTVYTLLSGISSVRGGSLTN